jgi:hypothetical protein
MIRAKLFGKSIGEDLGSSRELIIAAIPNCGLIGNAILVRPGLESRFYSESERVITAVANNPSEMITRDLDDCCKGIFSKLDENGVARTGASIVKGDVVIGRKRKRNPEDLSEEDKLLSAIFGGGSLSEFEDSSAIYSFRDPAIVKSSVFTPITKGKKKIKKIGDKAEVVLSVFKTLSVGDLLVDNHDIGGVVVGISTIPYRTKERNIDLVISPESGFFNSFEKATNTEIYDLSGKPIGQGVVGTIDFKREKLYSEDKISVRRVGTTCIISQQPYIKNGGVMFRQYQFSALKDFPSIVRDAIIFRGDNPGAAGKAYMEAIDNANSG